jgi:hypothetical protein
MYNQTLQNHHKGPVSLSTNLKNGFNKCGLFPFDRHHVLYRIPGKNLKQIFLEIKPVVPSVLVDMLESLRYQDETDDRPKTKKKVSVSHGESISTEDLTEVSSYE